MLESHILETFHKVFAEQHADRTPPSLRPESVLLETGLDSLGFALLVVRLEETLGFDPFLISSEPYYPRTFSEFVNFYRMHQPQ